MTNSKTAIENFTKKANRGMVMQTMGTTVTCSACDAVHHLCLCSTFCGWDLERRKNFIKRKHLCYNCLGHGHISDSCPSKKSRRECALKHHTFIHHQQQQRPSAQQTAPTVEQTPTPDPTRVLQVEGRRTTSLMETAVLKVTAGRTETIARALLDGGASLSLVTSRLATLLGAKKISLQMNTKGLEVVSCS